MIKGSLFTELNIDITKALEDIYIRKDILNVSYNQGYSASLSREENLLDYQDASHGYFFFVPPDCSNIDDPDSVENNEMCSSDLKSINPKIRKMLVSMPHGGKPVITIPLLNNLVKLDSISLPDINTGVFEWGETRDGARQVLPEWRLQSQTSHDLSISYYDVFSKELGPAVLSKLHKAWEIYINNLKDGTIHPGDKYAATTNNKIYNTEGEFNGWYQKRLNFVGSAYFFKLDNDGRTIIYWCKWTGLYPKTSSVSQFAGGTRELAGLDVTYQSQFFEELDIAILKEFNQLNMIGGYTPGNYNQNIILREFDNPYIFKLYYNTKDDKALVKKHLNSTEYKHEIVYSHTVSKDYVDYIRKKSVQLNTGAKNIADAAKVSLMNKLNNGGMYDYINADLSWIWSNIRGAEGSLYGARTKDVDISQFDIKNGLDEAEINTLNNFNDSLTQDKTLFSQKIKNFINKQFEVSGSETTTTTTTDSSGNTTTETTSSEGAGDSFTM